MPSSHKPMVDTANEGRWQQYVARINRALDYIADNLDGDLSLERIAKEAHFSPYHFHRLFRALVGEPLNGFIRRVRVERAATLLLAHPQRSITEVALDCGFSGSATFARAFRDRFGVSASDFRESKIRKTDSKDRQTQSKGGKASEPAARYLVDINPTHTRRLTMNIEMKELPELHVAYIRHHGPYQEVGEAFGKLMRWAGAHGLLQRPDVQPLGVYHDNPDITEEDKLRADACVTVPSGTQATGEVGLRTIPGGLFAVAHFEIDKSEFGDAWNQLMGEWLPDSGYEPDDRPCYERYLNDPSTHPEGKFVIEICQPVRPL
ncbi:MAG: AraC family transcriptional regulator [Myxococcota bacterium]